eukprot:gene15380-biopygen12658
MGGAQHTLGRGGGRAPSQPSDLPYHPYRMGYRPHPPRSPRRMRAAECELPNANCRMRTAGCDLAVGAPLVMRRAQRADETRCWGRGFDRCGELPA